MCRLLFTVQSKSSKLTRFEFSLPLAINRSVSPVMVGATFHWITACRPVMTRRQASWTEHSLDPAREAIMGRLLSGHHEREHTTGAGDAEERDDGNGE